MMGRALKVRIERAEALRRLRRRSYRGTDSPLSHKALPHLELVWLPYYRVAVEATASTAALVDATHGGAAWLAPEAEWESRGDPPLPPEGLTPAAARAEVLMLATRQRLLLRAAPGALRNRFREEVEVGEVELVSVPFWVYHYERRRGRLDVRLLDAASGRPAGAGAKRSLLAHFLALGRAARQAG